MPSHISSRHFHLGSCSVYLAKWTGGVYVRHGGYICWAVVGESERERLGGAVGLLEIES